MSINTAVKGIEATDLDLFVQSISAATPRTDSAHAEQEALLSELAAIVEKGADGDVVDITSLRDRMLAFIEDEQSERSNERALAVQALEGLDSDTEVSGADEEIEMTRGDTLEKVVKSVEQERKDLSMALDTEERQFLGNLETGIKKSEESQEIANIRRMLNSKPGDN